MDIIKDTSACKATELFTYPGQISLVCLNITS